MMNSLANLNKIKLKQRQIYSKKCNQMRGEKRGNSL